MVTWPSPSLPPQTLLFGRVQNADGTYPTAPGGGYLYTPLSVEEDGSFVGTPQTIRLIATFETGGGAASTPYGTSPPGLILNSTTPADVVLPKFTLPPAASYFRVVGGFFSWGDGSILGGGAVNLIVLSGQPVFVKADGDNVNNCTVAGDSLLVYTLNAQTNIDGDGLFTLDESGFLTCYVSSQGDGQLFATFFTPLDETNSFYVIPEAQGTFGSVTPAGVSVTITLFVEYL